jgi:radical SAM-linked protein
MRVRMEYRVGNDLKFLGNLDMMNLMSRALRRARIPFALSEGFNPHIKFSLGTVLPIGVWGEREYLGQYISKNPIFHNLPPNSNIQYYIYYHKSLLINPLL